MLELAILHKEALLKKYQAIALDDKFKYFNYGNYFEFNLDIADTTWNKLQMVSVNNDGEVIGFLQAKLDRSEDAVRSLWICNFYDINYGFSKDFYQFLKDLFLKFNFRKISFSVVVGNPAEKMYDKFIQKYNGRIVGIRKEDGKLQDNQYYDIKCYEIFKEDYLQAK